MTGLRGSWITAIDFEGTGSAPPWPDEPWQIGLIDVCKGRVVPASAFESLLRIGDRPFSPYAPGRHAEHRHALKTAPTLERLWPQLRPRLEGPILAAHHAGTETRYLSRAFPLHTPVIALDTLRLARHIYPGLENYRLEGLLGRLRLTGRVRELVPGRDAHDALYDAAGCAVLIEHMLSLPDWGNATLDVLIQAQAAKRTVNRHGGFRGATSGGSHPGGGP